MEIGFVNLQQPIILFDGVCNFCNGAVQAILKIDKDKKFLFAALQSAAGQRLLAEYHLSKTDLNTFIFIDKGNAFQKSAAALKVINYLPGGWRLLKIFGIIPPFIRDAVYDLIARNRYKWFGKKEACMIPSKELMSRFLD